MKFRQRSLSPPKTIVTKLGIDFINTLKQEQNRLRTERIRRAKEIAERRFAAKFNLKGTRYTTKKANGLIQAIKKIKTKSSVVSKLKKPKKFEEVSSQTGRSNSNPFGVFETGLSATSNFSHFRDVQLSQSLDIFAKSQYSKSSKLGMLLTRGPKPKLANRKIYDDIRKKYNFIHFNREKHIKDAKKRKNKILTEIADKKYFRLKKNLKRIANRRRKKYNDLDETLDPIYVSKLLNSINLSKEVEIKESFDNLDKSEPKTFNLNSSRDEKRTFYGKFGLRRILGARDRKLSDRAWSNRKKVIQ